MRLQGWEARLADVVSAARARPYVLGQFDCFKFACEVVQALTGVDRWPAFAGYSTKRECLAKLAQHGSSFEAAGDWFFGERIERNFARRGDIAALAEPEPFVGKHLAVVYGGSILALTGIGLHPLPLEKAHVFWRVG